MHPNWDNAALLQAPLYTTMRPALERWGSPPDWPTLADYQRLLDGVKPPLLTAGGKPLHVVAQATEKTTDWRQGYEPQIYLQGALQTRLECWHDAFNVLTWASFPLAKAALNARQYALLEARAKAGAPAARRSPSQDALTQFDESGVIVLSADPLLSELLLSFQWKPLFWQQRAAVQTHMRCFLFGHGLMERALTPYRGLTGKGVILPITQDFLAQPLALQVTQVDGLLAQVLGDGRQLLQPRDLAPVPLLGFPGFTPDNECADYYDDRTYFRPGRETKS